MSKDRKYSKWRLLSSQPASGHSHMALDQTLLESAISGDFPPSLRFYRWSPPALSIGRFQDISDIDLEACATQGFDVVRRPTGGKCILHLDDFTYSLVIPAQFALPEGIEEAYALICGGILAALRRLGLPAAIQSRAHDRYSQIGGACFATATRADLEYRGLKICGSAQVRRHGAVLQHGSILIADQSGQLFDFLRFKDKGQKEVALAGYRKRCTSLSETGNDYTWGEIAASFKEGFHELFNVDIEEEALSDWEKARWRDLIEVYESRQWLLNARMDDLPIAGETSRPPLGQNLP